MITPAGRGGAHTRRSQRASTALPVALVATLCFATLMLASARAPSQAPPGDPRAAACGSDIPGPDDPGWITREFPVNGVSGCNALFDAASVACEIQNADGRSASQGGYLRLTSTSPFATYFGETPGVVNDCVGPLNGGRNPHRFYLAIPRRRGDISPTRTTLWVRYFGGSGARDAGVVAADAGVATADASVAQYFLPGGPPWNCVVDQAIPSGIGCNCPPSTIRQMDPQVTLAFRCVCSSGTWDTSSRQCSPCPPGMDYRTDGSGPRCECRTGMRWDRAANQCVADTCTGGASFSTALGRCSCPGGQEWSDLSRRCLRADCAGGTVFNPATENCECPPSRPRWVAGSRSCVACPSGQSWVDSQCACPGGQVYVGSQCTCPAGSGQRWNGTACACPAGQVSNGAACACPAGQSMNNGACACPAGQVMNGGACACPTGQISNGTACVPAQQTPPQVLGRDCFSPLLSRLCAPNRCIYLRDPGLPNGCYPVPGLLTPDQWEWRRTHAPYLMGEVCCP